MGLLQATVGAFALYLLLHVYLLPRLYRQLPNASVASAYAHIFKVLLAEIAHAAALVVALALAAITASIWLLSQLSYRVSQTRLAATYEFLREVRDAVDMLSEWWGMGLILVLSLMLWLVLRKEARQQFANGANTAFENLKAEAEAGKLEDLPPTEDMKTVAEALDERKSTVIGLIAAAESEGGNPAMADPNQNQELATLLGEIDSLEKLRFELDVQRRLKPGDSLAQSANAAHSQSALRNMFLSPRFFHLVTGTSRVLSILSLALLLPALIAITGPQISETASQSSVAIHDLILKNSLADAQASWQKAIGQSETQLELSADDHKLIDQLSEHYANLIQQQNEVLLRVPAHVVRSVSQYAVRDQILRNFNAAPPALPSSGTPSTRLQAAQSKALAEAVTAVQPNSKPSDSIAERFRRDLTLQAKAAEPNVWKEFRTRAALAINSAPAASVRAEVLASKLFTEVVNVAGTAVGLPGAQNNAFRLLAENLLEPGDFVERARELNRLQQYRFLNQVLAHGSLLVPPNTLIQGRNVPLYSARTHAQLRQAAEKLESRLTTANRIWTDHPPHMRARAHGGQNLTAAQKELHAFLERGSTALQRARLPEALATFRDYFPGALGEEARTARAELVAAMSQSAGAAASPTREQKTNFNRARSYGGLRGFAKIGGVLIGLPPNRGKGPDILDLQWEQRNDGVVLMLTRDDGNVLTYGPFRATLIKQALAYAADGRPVTVTMPDAGIGRKVLSHPALVDSALACEARHLDQLVDVFTSRSTEREDATIRVLQHLLTYQFAWAVQFKEAMKKARDVDWSHGAAAQRANYADQIVRSAQIRDIVALTLKTPTEWRDATLSPVTIKSDYFEKGLVERIDRCLVSDDVKVFEKCIASSHLDFEYIKKGDWTHEPPRTSGHLIGESGVRELPYDLDADLEFLDLQKPRGATWPFAFIIQLSIESPRYFAKDPERTFDEQPFEYPRLRSWIEQKVAEGIETARIPHLNPRKTIADLREFTILQRFFRLALEGKLGERFPLESLVRLGAVEPHEPAPVVRTPVWNNPEAVIFQLRERGLAQLVPALGLSEDVATRNLGDGCPVINP